MILSHFFIFFKKKEEKANLTLSFYEGNANTPYDLNDDFLTKPENFDQKMLVGLEFWLENESFGMVSLLRYENNVFFF